MPSPSARETLPLFPLHTVLLPGAVLGLRVFEPRYLDLVSDCLREGRTFGVCLILEGEEAGAPALPAAVGCEALIEDFGSTGEGLLTLRVRGARRFRVHAIRIHDNGLVLGEVEWCAPEPEDTLAPEHAVLGTVLRAILDQVGGEHAAADDACFDRAAWVGWRLAELLPLPHAQRLALLEEDDPHARLQRIVELVG
ncbi:LON peptidase substrate-binding domain-containing protein [Vulcaniibacterium gelatinicum]|uniref:LON peptidase substrate-binding domain-containing protein n=1 Tax=Vulcaniibacterium gelatinicum TaxID=2598725 RepID=UPI0011C846A5|nr:LON peptidase substrate-binding domain-containing protein [Vulcaniibacterium gelatinicum]